LPHITYWELPYDSLAESNEDKLTRFPMIIENWQPGAVRSSQTSHQTSLQATNVCSGLHVDGRQSAHARQGLRRLWSMWMEHGDIGPKI
jgi:hypothetical protein